MWQSRSDWEIYKGFAKTFSEVCVGHLGVEKEVVLTPLMHDTPAELAQPFDVKDWKKGECELIPGKTAPQIAVVERDYPNVFKRFTALGPLMDKVGNGGKGIAWKTGTEVEQLGQLNGKTLAEGATQGMPKIVTDIDACEVILQLAPETNGHVAVKAWEALGKQTGRDHTHLALYREDEKIRFRDIQAQPRKIISSPTWSGIESETVSYNAGYTNVHELIPWRTLTGRQQFYLDHPWMIAFGEGFSSYRPPVDLKTTSGIHDIKPQRQPGDPAQLHHAAPEVGHPLHLQRQPDDADAEPRRPGDLAERGRRRRRPASSTTTGSSCSTSTAPIAARAVVSQRVNPGMVMMYHAQEKIINTPGSEITGVRGGIHNSVTRIVLKPTHMIGGYAQFSYGFNYYGTIGTNRDEFVVVRKMDKVDWLDTPRDDHLAAAYQGQGENAMKIRAQIGMVLNLDKCIGCHTCSVTCKNVWTSRPGMEYAWFNNVETKPGIGYPKEWENQDKWNGGWVRKADGSIEPRQGGKWKLLMRIFANPNLPQIDDYYEPFTFDYDHLQSAPEMKAAPTARPRSLITGQRMEKIVWGPNWEEILGGEFAKRSKDKNFDDIQKDIYGQFENTFMMYLPRLCEHCLNPACVASLPVGLDLQARGRRHRADRPGQVPRLAHVRQRLPVQEDLLQLEERQGREVHLLLPAHRGRPAHRVLARPASAASATSACCCTTPTASRRRPASSTTATCTRRSSTSSSTRTTRR